MVVSLGTREEEGERTCVRGAVEQKALTLAVESERRLCPRQ
jgi:hypothetical protein